MAAAEYVVAIDLGGTGMKAAVFDRRGHAGSAQHRSTPAAEGPEAVLDAVLGLAEELTGACPSPPAAVGLAVPGVVHERTGVVATAANLGWRDLALRDLAERRLNLPVSVSHDVRASALAEGLLGAARRARDYLLLTLGTGIGAAIVIGGRPYTGAHGTGGELGHVAVQPRGPLCRCGGEGCLEALASAGHLAARYLAMSGGDPPVDAAEVLRRSTRGDAVATRVWATAIDALAESLAGYVTLLDPELIVLGGGMIAAGEALFAPLRERVSALLRLATCPPIVPASLSRAGCYGAAIAAWRLAGMGEEELTSWAS